MQETKKDLWNADFYDSKHSFVSTYGNDVIELLNVRSGEQILDVGCGTGDLANVLHGLGAEVTGIDYSENMVALAAAKYPQIAFEVADAANLRFHTQFDAVFSNAALHWMKTPVAVIESIHKSLKPDGRFVAEFGGAGNVQTITDELIKQIRAAGIPYTDEQFPWYFPTIGEYTTLLESAGFHVGLALHFTRPTKLEGEDGLKNWLAMFSPSIFEEVAVETKEHIFNTTVENVRASLYRDGQWFADYKRLRVVAVKK
ncbi:MAG: methyltransferase domain-containing protein [Solibacillus sp.]